ncbi:uncharacterized protein METZ01_LOCUS445013, partial [marine metagenome]
MDASECRMTAEPDALTSAYMDLG